MTTTSIQNTAVPGIPTSSAATALVSELIGPTLDAWVAKIIGHELDADGYNLSIRDTDGSPTPWAPSTDPVQGMAILEGYRIATVPFERDDTLDDESEERGGQVWAAYTLQGSKRYYWDDSCLDARAHQADGLGPTMLIAGLRALVAKTYGKTVPA